MDKRDKFMYWFSVVLVSGFLAIGTGMHLRGDANVGQLNWLVACSIGISELERLRVLEYRKLLINAMSERCRDYMIARGLMDKSNA